MSKPITTPTPPEAPAGRRADGTWWFTCCGVRQENDAGLAGATCKNAGSLAGVTCDRIWNRRLLPLVTEQGVPVNDGAYWSCARYPLPEPIEGCVIELRWRAPWNGAPWAAPIRVRPRVPGSDDPPWAWVPCVPEDTAASGWEVGFASDCHEWRVRWGAARIHQEDGPATGLPHLEAVEGPPPLGPGPGGSVHALLHFEDGSWRLAEFLPTYSQWRTRPLENSAVWPRENKGFARIAAHYWLPASAGQESP